MDRKKVLELDKICRVCISERKDMRPLFSERVAEMLMECSNIEIENIEGWPDKICVQCVHSVSRCHAFKMLVERSDKELRDYIKSLTVRVIIDEPLQQQQQHQTIQQQQEINKIKFLQQQQQQKKLLQKKPVRILQKQVAKQPAQQLLHQQSSPTIKRITPSSATTTNVSSKLMQAATTMNSASETTTTPSRKASRASKKKISTKSTTASLQVSQQQHQQQQTVEQLLQQPPPLQHHIVQQSPQHNQPTALPPQQLLQPQQLQAAPQPQTQQQTIMPQQIVLPNGQIITTAQIVPTQLAQIINSNNATTTVVTPNVTTTAPTLTTAFPTQLIQTTNGQTLQLIQQPNGTQTLQLVQIVPQRMTTTQSGRTHVLSVVDDDMASMVEDDMTLIGGHEQLIDEDDENDDVGAEIDGDNDGLIDGKSDQMCETIVLDDSMHQSHLLHTTSSRHLDVITLDDDNLTQSETQDLEYLEDVTVTTTNQHHDGDDDSDSGGGQLLHDSEDIIEEIQMEEEMVDDENSNMMHVIENSTGEFISEDEDMHAHSLIEHDGDELQYTVLETDEVAIAEGEALEAAEGVDLNSLATRESLGFNHSGGSDSNNSGIITIPCTHTYSPQPKKRKANSKAMANSRVLAATATSIAAGLGDEMFEIDAKFINDFINQQTTALGSGRYVCNLCRQEFKQFKGMQNHMYQHTNWIRANCKKQPECEICHKSFKGPGMLKMHMKTHESADRVPTCNICGKCFNTKAILYRHRQTHQLRLFLCGLENCRKTFTSANTLRAHGDRKHPEITSAKYKCGECGLKFEDTEVLRNHLLLCSPMVSTRGLSIDEDIIDGDNDVIIVTQA